MAMTEDVRIRNRNKLHSKLYRREKRSELESKQSASQGPMQMLIIPHDPFIWMFIDWQAHEEHYRALNKLQERLMTSLGLSDSTAQEKGWDSTEVDSDAQQAQQRHDEHTVDMADEKDVVKSTDPSDSGARLDDSDIESDAGVSEAAEVSMRIAATTQSINGRSNSGHVAGSTSAIKRTYNEIAAPVMAMHRPSNGAQERSPDVKWDEPVSNPLIPDYCRP
eukprot:TRINITY_DN12011_c0_g2_i2.p1 TRINITY_DN12011_c0_g2~~TRINITY_DN12011_c0_g2_i2.p1  ORF type:complete len:221 (-),score=30.92 TRINITY_DN12011_c0_g2_i2:96-758(-)